MDKKPERTKALLNEIDRLAYIVAIGLSTVLVFTFFLIQSWEPPKELAAVRELALALIPNLVSVLLIFAFSYALLRRVQSIKSEQESDELAGRVATELQSDLAKFSQQAMANFLRDRSEILPLKEFGQTASELIAIGISHIGLLQTQLGFFEQKLREGCRLRFVLLDPDSSSLQSWNLIATVSTTQSDIQTALELLKSLTHLDKTKGKCEVRLTQAVLPYGMLIADVNKPTGEIIVEMYTYKTSPEERPNFRLTPSDRWFEFFKTQAEKIWNESEKN